VNGRGHGHGHGHGHGRGHGGRSRFVWMMHMSLRRRLFRGFGLAIGISGAIAWAIHAALAPSPVAVGVALASAALVMWVAAGAIAWKVTRPLVELVSVTRDLGEGKLDRRMRLPPFRAHAGEVAVLADAINTMAERIERQIADQHELLAVVSHELRTPLGHVRVLLDTARERSGDAALLDELEREVVELDALVDQLLAHSRLEFDRIERRRLDPVELAVRALERVGEDASKLEVETEVERVDADPTLVGRALANLIVNARTHGRGLESLRIRDADGLLCFVAHDRGPGFTDGDSEAGRMFESFVQGGERTHGSLGLGLALVRRIAEAHGGRAWATNRGSDPGDPDGGGAEVGFSIVQTFSTTAAAVSPAAQPANNT
jgi:two-component system, OmpR family, sensor kinase